MAEIEIRPAVSSDIPELMRFDHTVETTHIWQVACTKDEHQMEFHFIESKLPRPLRLVYPKRFEEMADNWTKHSLFLTARMNGNLAGYLILSIDYDTRIATITDLVVNTPTRNQGIASGMVISVLNGLRNKGLRKLSIAIPVRNHAAISLVKRLKMDFNGFIDHYFINQDGALIFTMAIR
jgi:ribosomal protein S18 acetylase RimI-like enzyme